MCKCQLIISSDNLKLIGYLLPLILVEEGPDNDFEPLQQKHFSVYSLIFSVLRAQTKPTFPMLLGTQNSQNLFCLLELG